MNYRKRVLLCTSPLQVINARSAMDYNQHNGVHYEDYLVIVHPILTKRSRYLIQSIGRRLNYTCISDISDKYKSIVALLRIRSFENSNFLPSRKCVQERNKKIGQIIHQIRELFYGDGQYFDEIYCRNMSSIEKLLLDTCFIGKQIYRIEDGIGDYENKITRKKRKRTLELQLQGVVGWLAKLVLGYKPVYIKCMLPKKKRISGSFLNLSQGNHILIQDYFRENVNKVVTNNEFDPSKQVVIVGSLLGISEKCAISISEEVEIYNKVLQLIKRKYRISGNEIWYKPHPRITYENWKYKKDKLKCRIYDFENNPLFEIEMPSPHLKAVYSVGSTSLLYAKAIFGLEAYLIDLRKYNIHPTAFDMYYDVLTRYGADVIDA